jgi:membrane fusion protein, multidrug efflux system
VAAPNPPLFRDEAIAHQRSRGLQAELLAIDARSTAWGFRLLCAGLIASVAFLALGRLDEYASGPAVVQLEGRTTLTASFAGLVTKVAVKPGDRVEAGDELVRFHASDEAAELQAASREFDNQLAKLLLRPDDAATREALVSLRTRRELAQQRAEQRTLRAPHAGVVGDVRVRAAELVEPGARVLDLQQATSTATLIALLPGRYRPLLHAGDRMRFEIDGFRHRAQELTVTRVGDQIVGPAEAARFIGRDLADAFAIDGPVVLVQANLPQTSFEIDGQRYAIASGMFGRAEARVRDEPIAYVLIPGLRPWLQRVRSAISISAVTGWVNHVLY